MLRHVALLLALFAMMIQSRQLWAQDPESLFNFNIGGGITTPVNPTGSYAGVSGNFVFGAGYNFTSRHSAVGQFMWAGLPPNRPALHPLGALSGSVNLYTLTANYKYRLEGERFGGYFITGGGWYYRYAKITNSTIAPGTTCAPLYDWWGYVCESGFIPVDNVLAYKGVSSGGVNGGLGLTVKLHPSGIKFYMEARYHYASSNRVSTQIVPVTFGLAF